ncbi:MAG TPA: hypothetical protein VMZ04_07225 [Anaerolineae bacterium]|nr:hypothetical protein [Anaerolineae bacterium]
MKQVFKKSDENVKGIFHKKNKNWETILVFILIFTVYLVTLLSLFPNLPVIARQAENIPGYDVNYPPFRVDEYNYYAIARNVLSGRLYEEGSYERGFTVGFPLIAAPFIAVLGKIGGYVANMFIIWISLVFFFLILRRYGSRWKALIITIILAFATLNWFYAVSCYTEPLSQLLVLLSFYLITMDRDSRRWDLAVFLAGFSTALNLFVRPHYILLVMPFFLYLWIHKHKKHIFDNRAFIFTAGAAIILVIWIIRNVVVFGGPLTFEYSRLIDTYVPGTASSYMKGNVFLGTHRLLFDQYHGLFTITPILLLFPAGLRSMWLNGFKKDSLVLFISVVMIALFVASGSYPFTEFGLGSRHMLPVIPLMMVPCIFFLDEKLFSRSIVMVLAVYSLYHEGIGWFTGGEPGMGFFLGILNDNQSRAIILARKGLLPRKSFENQQELIDTFRKALKKADLMKLLQTMDPLVIKNIQGNERNFMIYLRNQKNPIAYIKATDPQKGIIIKSFSTSKGIIEEGDAEPDSSMSEK